MPTDDASDLGPGPTRADYVGLAACGGKCAVHIVLGHERGGPFADAPMTRETAVELGRALLAIGSGEDVDVVGKKYSEGFYGSLV